MNFPAYFPEPQINPPWVDEPDPPERPPLKWHEVLVHAIDTESEGEVVVLARRVEYKEDGTWECCQASPCIPNAGYLIFQIEREDEDGTPYYTDFTVCRLHAVDLLLCMAAAPEEGFARAMALDESPLSYHTRWYIQEWVKAIGRDTRFDDGEG